MITPEPITSAPTPSARRGYTFWLRLSLGLLLGAAGIWLVTREVNLTSLGRALSAANGGLVGLALAVMIFTLVVKTWRWQLLFYPREHIPPFSPAFWALMLGQFFNNVLSPVRIGELARVYDLADKTGVSKAQSLGTILVEKALDMIMTVLTALAIIPWVVLPQTLGNPWVLAGVGGALLAALYFLAYRTEWVASLIERLAPLLPTSLEQRVLGSAVSGLRGLAALRDRRVTLWLVLLSALAAFLAVLTPFVMFLAFHLPLNLAQAALIQLGLGLGLAVPSTPGKVGVFEGIVYTILGSLGLRDETARLSYALVFHVVVIAPQIIFGGIAAARARRAGAPALAEQGN